MRSFILRGLGAVAIIVASSAGVGLPAQGATSTSDRITWSVVPANETGPDGRAWIELDVAGGETVHEHLAVRNLGDQPVTFSLSAADGYLTSSGRFNMLPASTPSTGAGAWIDVADEVEVGAGATAVIPFSIEVPTNATPGDIAAGVAASIRMAGADAGGAQVGVDSRVGFRVMIRVGGDLEPEIDIRNVTATYATSWNPFSPGRVTVDYEVENTGNARLTVKGAAASAGSFREHPVVSAEVESFPGDSRKIRQTIADVWPIGLIRVGVEVSAADPTGESRVTPVVGEVWVWAVPGPQLIVVGALTLLIAALAWRRTRRIERVERLVATARREGLREGQASTVPVSRGEEK